MKCFFGVSGPFQRPEKVSGGITNFRELSHKEPIFTLCLLRKVPNMAIVQVTAESPNIAKVEIDVQRLATLKCPMI